MHTSTASFPRLRVLHRDFFAANPFIQNGSIHVRAVVSHNASVDDGLLPISRVDCSDAHGDLPCRVDASYAQFLADFPNCGYLFRGEDDTFVNLRGLYHYIVRLGTQYRAERDIVFRAHANPEKMKNWYIHGGGGWLASRAFVDAHVRRNLSLRGLLRWARYHQQDTAESIVVRRFFAHSVLWDEHEIQGFACDNCKTAEVLSGNWSALGGCPDGVAVRIRDIWAMHTAGLQGHLMKLVEKLDGAPENVLLFRDNMPQRGRLCLRQPGSVVWNAGRRPLAYLTLEELPDPIIDYANLQDDNVG